MTFNSTLLRMINSQNSQVYKESSYQGLGEWRNGELVFSGFSFSLGK